MIDESTSGEVQATARDEEAVARFVERFGGVLVEAGFPRMAARVFSVLMASEDGRLTAAELAERLQASPAAISGAVRYLVQLDLTSRQREPGTRRDCYVVDEDVWTRVIEHQTAAVAKWGDRVREGIAAVGEDSAAGRRLADTASLFDFIQVETPAVLRRWRERHAKN